MTTFAVQFEIVYGNEHDLEFMAIAPDDGPYFEFPTAEAAAVWIENLTTDDPENQLRKYASRVRREGPKIAREVRHLGRPMPRKLMRKLMLPTPSEQHAYPRVSGHGVEEGRRPPPLPRPGTNDVGSTRNEETIQGVKT